MTGELKSLQQKRRGIHRNLICLAPEVGSGKFEQLVAPSAHHGLHHVKREARGLSVVTAGGMTSSVQLATASTSTGPSWTSAAAMPASTAKKQLRARILLRADESPLGPK